MNRYQDAIQTAIALLGDHVGRAQLLMRNLAESRDLVDGEIDPEAELAIECWIEEAADLVYHLLVTFAERGVDPGLMSAELEHRHG